MGIQNYLVDHLWHVDRVRAPVDDKDQRLTFFCGGSRNVATFVDLFDAVFVLQIDRPTLDRRLEQRPEGEFGARQAGVGSPATSWPATRTSSRSEH